MVESTYNLGSEKSLGIGIDSKNLASRWVSQEAGVGSHCIQKVGSCE